MSIGVVRWIKRLKIDLGRVFKTTRNMDEIRRRPFIVVCGCTGTGKTKLSIQLAEWLIQNGHRAEIINADAMQLYKGLEIITNKATEEEMKGVKHHLLGYLDSTVINNMVTDYKDKAVELIDKLLEEKKIPILVGGTHYYIQSVIWNNLIDSNEYSNSSNKTKILDSLDNDSEIVKLIVDCMKKKESNGSASGILSIPHIGTVLSLIDAFNDIDDLNVLLHDSKIPTEEIFNQLEQVDPQSALRIHHNDRRKLCRALQIFYNHGISKTSLLELKHKELGSRRPLRYKNVCMFVLNCETETLNKRLDDRVDQMLQNGLFKEIQEFKKEFQQKCPGQTLKEFSRDFEFGIFQSIGFKEFDEYLELLDTTNSQNTDDTDLEARKKALFDQGVSEMKASTRRYAKSQMKWVRNKFVKRVGPGSPIVYELDTTNLEKWNENVFDKARDTFKEKYLDMFEAHPDADLNKNDGEFYPDDVFEFNKCEICDREFKNKFQWECHLNGAKHRKRKEKLARDEKLKLFKASQASAEENKESCSNK